LEEKVALKNQEAEKSSAKIGELTSQVATLEEKSSSKEGELAETLLKVAALTATIEALTREKDEATASQAEQASGAQAELQQSIQELEEKVALKNQEAEKSSAKIGELTSQVATLEEKSSSKEGELAETLLKVEALTASLEALKRENGAPKEPGAVEAPEETETLTPEEEEELWQSIKDLEEKVALKTQEAVESSAEIAALTSQVTTLEEESSKKGEDLAATVLKVNELTTAVETLTRERDEAMASPAEVSVSSDATKAEGESELAVAKLQARIDELESELQFLRLANEKPKEELEESGKNDFSNIKISEEKPADMDHKKVIQELVNQKIALQEENSFLIGELTEAKIELAELKMG